MKSKLHISAAIFVFLALSLTGSLAQGPGAPATPATPAFDPQTGIPIPPGSDWKDSDWKDPEIVLTNVSYNGLPLSEIARDLRDRFQGQFDLLLPAPNSGGPIRQDDTDWTQISVDIQLRNVTASELFNAMNMLFENNRTPLRWELKVNGHRQIALLHVLVDPAPPSGLPPDSAVQRRVYFVGNLIGDEKSGGMTMEQIINTITDVWKMADSAGGTIQFHKEAQLLVVTGTPAQIDFMEQTLAALNQKVNLQKSELAPPERHGAKPAVPSSP
jgi:hypothetical protein